MLAAMPIASAELLERLLGFDTQSFRSNLELVGVRAGLSGASSGSRRGWCTTTRGDQGQSLGGDRARATCRASCSPAIPTWCRWRARPGASDPFRARIDGGRIYGRGAADMKGFLACVLALVPELLAAELRKPAILAFSYDEEVGCKGVPRLIEALLAELPPPEACLVGEPTLMRLVDGHKGKAGYRCTITGREAHSAYPELGANAVSPRPGSSAEVAAMGDRFAADGAVPGRLRPAAPHLRRRPDRGRLAAQHHPAPLQLRVRVPHPAGRGPDALRARGAGASPMRRSCPACARPRPRPRSSSRRSWPIPACCRPPDTRLRRACAASSPARRSPAKVSFGTEGGCFAARGIPSLVCGPGDISVAHKPDEWIALEQLERCDAFLRELVRAALG